MLASAVLVLKKVKELVETKIGKGSTREEETTDNC